MCRCGHPMRDHRMFKGSCDRFIDGLDDPFIPGVPWEGCPCKAYDDSNLPAPGERLEFGVHRLNTVDAETAEAWPPMSVVRQRANARVRRALRR